jgi:ubiquitin C-terminal hydrolase
MQVLDLSILPSPMGLNNTGSICYLNSFLQSLLSCSSFISTAKTNRENLCKTSTGEGVLSLINGMLSSDFQFKSSQLLSKLIIDLNKRRPFVKFGNGQESSSEVFIHILEMLNKEDNLDNPIIKLFLYRLRCSLFCKGCKKIVSYITDYSVIFNLYYFDSLKHKPDTPESFSDNILRFLSETEDYKCSQCQTKTNTCRSYTISMISEIIVCVFNLYVEYGGSRIARYFPLSFNIPGVDGNSLVYKLVAQIEHSGSLSGGHYWARCIRNDGKTYLFNDSSVSESSFTPSPNTYMIIYHITK